MNLETAVCILATANVIISLFSILCCYAINQLSVKNLSEARLTNQNAAADLLVAEKVMAAVTTGAKNAQ